MRFDARTQASAGASAVAADELAPPGRVEEVSARRVLVIAPHYDDETLGCGGLLIQLAASGAVIDMLYLSDSAGGAETAGGSAEYARTRKEESRRAGAILGVGAYHELGLPDGRLSNCLDAIASGIREALTAGAPDLILVPSDREVTSDHRAAFSGLRMALAGAGDIDTDTTILHYELNQPLSPDLLVDVSPQLDLLVEAIRCYRSQLQMHPYLQAALGLRRYRTYTLAPGVEAVEAFRRLRVRDLVDVNPAAAVGSVASDPGAKHATGATPDPQISVVVRTLNRPRRLAQALESIAASDYSRLEVVLVNDGGIVPRLPTSYPLPVVRVELGHTRGRAAAAQAGVDASSGEFIAFLDDDDLLARDHFRVLATAAREQGARVVYSDAVVGIHRIGDDGAWERVEKRFPYGRGFDPDRLVLDNYIPINTVLVARSLARQIGPFDASLELFEDWDWLLRLSAEEPFVHVARVTCEYRHFVGSDQALGSDPRLRSDYLQARARVLEKHRERVTPACLARVVDLLSAEAVHATAERDGLRAKVNELQRAPIRFLLGRLRARQ